jgi:hypothetical protein
MTPIAIFSSLGLRGDSTPNTGKRTAAARILLTTAHGNPQAKAEAEALGALFLEKPVSLETLDVSAEAGCTRKGERNQERQCTKVFLHNVILR